MKLEPCTRSLDALKRVVDLRRLILHQLERLLRWQLVGVREIDILPIRKAEVTTMSQHC